MTKSVHMYPDGRFVFVLTKSAKTHLIRIIFFSQMLMPYFFFPSLLLHEGWFKSDTVQMENITENDEKSSRISIKKNSTGGGGDDEKKDEASDQFNVPNNNLSYRSSVKLNGLKRIYHFHNAPVIKFVSSKSYVSI